jgi:hypothetical protein
MQHGAFQVASVETPSLINTLNNYAIGTPLDSQASALQTDDSLSPSSLDSVVADRSIKAENYGNSSSVSSLNCMDNDQVTYILCWNKPVVLIYCHEILVITASSSFVLLKQLILYITYISRLCTSNGNNICFDTK